MENFGRLDYWLKNTWLKVARLYNQEAQKKGITLTIAQLLLLVDKEGTPSSSLGPMLGMEASSLTRTIKSLMDKKWIIKKSDENDGRVTLIFLTDLGVEKRREAKQKVEVFNQEMKKIIPENLYNNFFEVIQMINTHIDNNSNNIFNTIGNNDK